MSQLICTTVLLSVIGSGLPGCGGDEATQSAGFVFVTNAPHKDLDPQKMSWMRDIRLTREMFEPLVKMNYDAIEIQPAVAERWEVSDDKRVYTFHLRDDAKWSNGDPVTAQDFVYAWRRTMLPETGASYTDLVNYIEGAKAFREWRAAQLGQFESKWKAQWGGDAAEKLWTQTEAKFDELVGLDTPDEHTLVVTLEKPTPYFLQIAGFVTLVPVHRPSVEAATELNEATGQRTTEGGYWDTPAKVVSNGPYHMTAREHKKHVRLERNPHYWNKDAVKTRVITERIAGDPQAARRIYENDEAHFWPDVPTGSDLAAKLVSANRADVHAQALAGTYFYNFNCQPTLPNGEPNPLTDARVRRALSMAINRETLVQRVTGLNQPIARSFVPPDVLPDYQPPMAGGLTYNPQRARALLKEAGHSNGEGLTGLSITYNSGGGHGQIAQAVKGMWERELGVIVSLESVPDTKFGERLDNQQYSIARASWIGDYADASTWLEKMTTTSNNNDCAWSNAEYDTLLEQASSETDEARRLELMRQAEQILVREQPMALMFHYKSVYMWDPSRVKGLESNNWGRWNMSNVELVNR